MSRLAFCWLCLASPLLAQEKAPATLPLDASLRNQLHQIHDDIAAEEYKSVCEKLQLVLQEPGDVFVEVMRSDGGKETTVVSARAEAERILGALPAKGLDVYRALYGAAAENLLAAAKEKKDGALAEVSRRYLATDAGREATRLLAARQLERGEVVLAARNHARLLALRSVYGLDTRTRFRAAQSFHRVGDRDAFNKVWKHLETIGKDGVRIGDEKKQLAELWKQLDRPTMKSKPLTEWRLVGGDASRSAQTSGGPAFLDKLWSHPAIRTKKTKNWLAEAAALEGQQQPVSPTEPLALVVQEAKGAVPLVVYRNWWGLQAVNVANGKLFWETPSKWSLDRMAIDETGGKLTALEDWLGLYREHGKPHILFENSVVGALSSDGSRVFAIEDFMVPPFPPGTAAEARRAEREYSGSLGDMIHHNRLEAFDLATGKLVWEIGQRSDPKERDKLDAGFDLTDVYFRAAPLPLGDVLWALLERRQVLYLAQLDPRTGKLRGKPLKLVEYRQPMTRALHRRLHAAHLAVGDGVVVCPTGDGMILGVDPTGPAVLWTHAYPPAQLLEPKEDSPRPGLVRLPDGRYVRVIPLRSGWYNTPPMIHDGKVLFAPAEGGPLMCLRLRAGSFVWKTPQRERDRYLAGVVGGKVVVVGERSVRGLDLADGKDAWTVEPGVPSGRGIASGSLYFLPLKSAKETREPGICAIDATKGTIQSFTRSPNRDVLGNLLFFQGQVVSLGINEVAGYPQLAMMLEKIDAFLSKNPPNDPSGLALRAALRLDRGDVKAAVTDLRAALANKPPRELEPRIKERLWEALHEYFQRDFKAAEPLLEEFKKLSEEPPGEEEKRRRSVAFHSLLACGMESKGKPLDALHAYLKIAHLPDDRLQPLPGDSRRSAAVDVWLQREIADLLAGAKGKQREELDDFIARRAAEVHKGNDLDAWRNFVRLFGGTPAGRQLRFELAERLLKDKEPALLEAEQHLQILRRDKTDAPLAGRAVEMLAKLMLQRDLLEDSLHYYRVLRRDFTKVILHDGKTGSSLFDEIATDKRLLPLLEKLAGLSPGGRSRGVEERGRFPAASLYQFERLGEDLPFFQRYQLALDLESHEVKVLDRLDKNREVWSQKLTHTDIKTILDNHRDRTDNPIPLSLPYQNLGHLIVLQLGHRVFGLDPIGKQLLWEKSLSAGTMAYESQKPDVQDNVVKVMYEKNWSLRLGLSLAMNAEVICLLTSAELIGVDPVSGKTLWSRDDVASNAYLHHDHENVYVVELGGDDQVMATKAFRLRDGGVVRIRDFTALYKQRVRMFDRRLLMQDRDNFGVTLRLHDVIAGKDVWKQVFVPNSKVLESTEPELFGVVEPHGKVTVLRAESLEPVLVARMRPEHLTGVERVHLLKDRANYYVACVKPIDARFRSLRVPSNFSPSAGVRSIEVNGMLYAFDSATGKMRLYVEADHQQVLLEHFDDLPMMVMTARGKRWIPGLGQERLTVSVVSFDKRTGKMIFERKDETGNMEQFHAVRFDPKSGRFELESRERRIRFESAPR